MSEVISTRESKIARWGSSNVLIIDAIDKNHLLGSDVALDNDKYIVKEELSRNKKGQNYIAFWLEEKKEVVVV